MDKGRLPLPYVYKYILYTYIQKTHHIAREVYGTHCNNLHGKRISNYIDIYIMCR